MSKTLKDQYEEEKKLMKWDAEELESATGFSHSCIYHGSAADSSDRASARYKWVMDAIDIITERQSKEILTLAAKLCRDSIGE